MIDTAKKIRELEEEKIHTIQTVSALNRGLKNKTINNKQGLYDYKYKTEKQLKAEFNFFKQTDSNSLQQSRRNLEKTYKNFFAAIVSLFKYLVIHDSTASKVY